MNTGRIAAAALDYLHARAAAAIAGADGDWRNRDVREAFVQVLRRIEITCDPAGTVRATAPDTHNGHIWAYAGGDALRAAHPGGTLARTGPTTYTLTLP